MCILQRTLRLLVVVAMFSMTLGASGQSSIASAANSMASPAPVGANIPGARSNQAASPPIIPSDYIVGIEDELKINVWKEPELSTGVVVRPDGKITVPLVDDIYVVGMTTKQLQETLTERLRPFVNEPQVTVVVESIRSRKVYLVGQVGRSGSFNLNGRRTALEMLVEAGGLGPYAKADNIYILRRQGETEQRLKFNYKKALRGNDPKSDILLIPGDIIVVP